MPLVIREMHPASSPAALNEEWLVVENTGQTHINTAGCTLAGASRNRKVHATTTLQPGFVIKAGERVRLVSGSPAKKAQGTPPEEEEGLRNYYLLLKGPLLAHEGTTVRLLLKQHELASAVFAQAAG